MLAGTSSFTDYERLPVETLGQQKISRRASQNAEASDVCRPDDDDAYSLRFILRSFKRKSCRLLPRSRAFSVGFLGRCPAKASSQKRLSRDDVNLPVRKRRALLHLRCPICFF